MVEKQTLPVKIIIYTFVFVFSFLFLYPMWHTFVVSISTATYANSLGFKVWPPNINLSAYDMVVNHESLLTAFSNTIFRAVLGTSLAVFVSFCAAYALSREGLPFKSIITFFFVFTMFFSGGLIPTYLNIQSLGLNNTRWALILPMAASAWNIVIMRNFVAAIPQEIEDSALVDGANPLQIMFRIIFPVSLPVVAVVVLWMSVAHWNAWFDALLYANRPELIVLQLLVRRMTVVAERESNIGLLSTAEMTSASIKSATVIVCTLPILAVYPFLQRYLVKGVLVGSVKG